MPVESLFDRLEPLLPQVSKPIQYVGGELNSQVKDWDVAGEATVRWALMYPDAYEVGLPNQGVMILYEVLNERPDALAERTYAVWPDLEALMREHGVPQFTVDAHRPVGAFDLLGLSASRPSSATRTCSPRSTSPASRCEAARPRRDPPGRHRRRARRVQPRADRRLRRRRRARRRRAGRPARSPTSSGTGRPRAAPAAARSCCCGWPAPAASTCPGSTTSTTCPTGGSSASCRTGPVCRGGSASTP